MSMKFQKAYIYGSVERLPESVTLQQSPDAKYQVVLEDLVSPYNITITFKIRNPWQFANVAKFVAVFSSLSKRLDAVDVPIDVRNGQPRASSAVDSED